MSSDNICVAVRVRPFNGREIKRNSKLCIGMNCKVKQVTIEALEKDNKDYGKQPRKFTFDYVYWSHDGSKKAVCKEMRKEASEKGKYELKNVEDDRHTNMDVYNDLGKKILENAWEGYNASIFAYGQTGSGKSYSMVGYGEDKGIIPLICDELFVRIKRDTTEKITFKVEVTMIEIYNEMVRDLFTTSKNRPPGGLKVREHPKMGPYVAGLNKLPASNYREISDLMDRGSRSRTVASTNMNQTSSRAHTLFTIELTIREVHGEGKKDTFKCSKITLVDLAGSERADATGATGDRLKEGCAINQSLSALGNVISALVKKCNAKGRKKNQIFIPYRTSKLTWLLRESLGGNAKTIMIAALSPASINYEETVSTLKYANRAKQITNKAVVNEDPNVKMIKSLKKELEEMKKKLAETDTSEVEKLKQQLIESQQLIHQLKISENEESAQAKKLEFQKQNDEQMSFMGVSLSNTRPCITNVHPDETMNNKIIFTLKEGESLVGKQGKASKAQIKLGGASIRDSHCIISSRDTKVFIKIGENKEAKTYVNGVLLEDDEEIELNHYDRLLIGTNHAFRIHNPFQMKNIPEEELKELESMVDYTFIQQEYADKNGLSSMMDDSEKDQLVQQQIKKEMEKLEKMKREEQMRYENERKELLEKQKKMEEQFRQMQTKQKEMQEKEGKGKKEATEDLKNKKMVEEQKRQIEELRKQQELLERRKRKLEEETRRQEELQKQIKENAERVRRRKIFLEKKLFELIPMVQEANEYAKELDKNIRFNVKLLNFLEEDERGKQHANVDIVIETKKDNGENKIWTFDKFSSRFYQMQPLYQEYVYKKDEDVNYHFSIAKEEDPFWDPEEEKSILLGIALFNMKCLTHLLPMVIETPIFRQDGEKLGALKCGIIPTNEDGEHIIDEFLADPTDLEGKKLHFKVIIENASNLPKNMCSYTHVQYSIPSLKFLDLEKTNVVEKTTRSPNFNYEKMFTIEKVSKLIVRKMIISTIKFEIFARKEEILEEKAEKDDKMLRAVQRLARVVGKKRKFSRAQSKQAQFAEILRKLRQ